MRRVVRLLFASALLLAPVPPLWAEDARPNPQCPICRAADSQSAPFHQRAAGTLMRGMTNTSFGWTEMLTQPKAEVEHGGNLAVGMGKGIGLAIKRTAAGVGEMFTFWVPRGPRDQPLAVDCPICALPTRPRPPASSNSSSTTAPSTSSKP